YPVGAAQIGGWCWLNPIAGQVRAHFLFVPRVRRDGAPASSRLVAAWTGAAATAVATAGQGQARARQPRRQGVATVACVVLQPCALHVWRRCPALAVAVPCQLPRTALTVGVCRSDSAPARHPGAHVPCYRDHSSV